VRVYKLAKIFTICVSVQKVPVARLAKPPKTEFTLLNEYFGGERNTANGTLWTDTKLYLIKRAWSLDFSFGFAALFTKKPATKGHV